MTTAYYKAGYHRANRVGLMLGIITLFQYGVPALFFWVLRQYDVDVQAQAWGLDYTVYLLLYLLMYVLMMGIPMLISLKCLVSDSMRYVSPLNLSPDRRVCVVLSGTAMCLVANVIAALVSRSLYDAGVKRPNLPQVGDGLVLTLVFDVIVFAVVPAVMEEVLLRGMVLQALRPMGDRVAVVVSAVFFGLMHGNAEQIPYALLMGLVLGGVFVYTDNLRLTVFVHALANALAVVTSYLVQYCETDVATLWQTILIVVVGMLGAVAAVWLWRHPLDRTKTTYDAPLVDRVRALLCAPLLWVTFVGMIVLMILFN